MKINLENMSLELLPETIEMLYNNEHFEKWFRENKAEFKNIVQKFLHDYGWVLGGAQEMNFDVVSLYKEKPYNLTGNESVRLVA